MPRMTRGNENVTLSAFGRWTERRSFSKPGIERDHFTEYFFVIQSLTVYHGRVGAEEFPSDSGGIGDDEESVPGFSQLETRSGLAEYFVL